MSAIRKKSPARKKALPKGKTLQITVDVKDAAPEDRKAPTLRVADARATCTWIAAVIEEYVRDHEVRAMDLRFDRTLADIPHPRG